MPIISGYPEIVLKPIGVVRSNYVDNSHLPPSGIQSYIEIHPEYERALLGIGDNSHLWLLLWFHKAQRNVLATVPKLIDPDLPERGVFSLRAFNRPNPIALSLVKLEGVDKNRISITGLDAIDGTPVLDIKPYYERDIVFSPKTPYLRPRDYSLRKDMLLKQALMHHQEKCNDLLIGIRMGLIADEIMGNLFAENLTVSVTGSHCLADTIQGITHARLANPTRFCFELSKSICQTVWAKDGKVLTIALHRQVEGDQILELNDDDFLTVDLKFI